MKTVYICNIFDPDLKEKLSITSDSPAAFHKVSKVSSALNKVNVDISVVSIAMGNTKEYIYLPASKKLINDVKFIYLPSITIKVFRNIFSMFSLLVFFLKNNKNIDNIIFYNYQPEYILLFFFSRLFNKNLVLDIEDGVNTELPKYSFFFRKFLLNLYLFLCKNQILTVSKALSDTVKSNKKYVCYGVNQSTTDQPRKLDEKKIEILFSGTLNVQTGVNHLFELIDLLKEESYLNKKVIINISGFGTSEKMLAQLADENSFVNFFGRLSQENYDNLLIRSNVGLVLKDPKTSMGATTFPSKVVELTSHGLLLITTSVSDLPYLFENKEVIFVDTPEDTLRAIEWILNNKNEADDMAIRSLRKAQKVFNEVEVGNSIKEIFCLA